MFFIGESFMCDWLPQAIAFAKGRGIEYAFLTTNGSLATPERVQACLDAGLDSLKFSMNNADVERFRRIARVKGQATSPTMASSRLAASMRATGGSWRT